MPTDNPNQRIFDASVRHQINLIRYAEGIQNAVLRELKKSEPNIRGLIQTWGGYPEEARLRRVATLLARVEAHRTKAWTEADKVFRTKLRELSKLEPQIVAARVGVVLEAPSAEVIRDIVVTRQVEGRTAAQWLRTLRSSDLARLRASVARGATQGDTGPAVARATLGSSSLGGADGALAAIRRQVQSVARTTVTHVSSEVQAAVLAANPNAFDRELFTAILDTRTTAVCRSHDGEVHPIGKGPQPPLHFNCRSRRVPLLKGFPDPLRQDYATWVAGQSPDVQDDALGVAKARLFRTGKLTLKEFVVEGGRELTLAELASRGITE